MGLAEFLLGAQNPFAQWTNQNQNLLGAIGAGLGQGQNIQSGLSAGLAAVPQAKALDYTANEKRKADAKVAAQTDAFKAYVLASKRPDLAPLLDAGVSRDEIFNTIMGKADGEAPSTVREYEYFNRLSPEAQAQYLRMKRANPYLDIGTGFVQPDPLNPGQVSGGPIVKDNLTPARDAAFGAGMGKVDVETTQAADALASKMPGLKSVVSELGNLAKTATYTQTGQLFDAIVRETGQMPPEGAIARTKYIAMVDNQVLPLLRDTFGAAFTVKEGETLRATLGNPNVSPVEKQAILEAFIEQKVRDLDALQSRLPQPGGAAPTFSAPAGGVAKPSTKYPGVTITAVP